MIKLQNVFKSYHQAGRAISVLKNLSFALEKGQTLAVTGPSGSGKTTLLSLLAGLDTPDKGRIFIESQEVSQMTESARMAFRREYIGIVFQQFHLMPHLTALENVSLALEIAGRSFKKSEEEALDLLKNMGLSQRLNHLPSDLSGGEQQRTAIARAIALKPALLLADEPSGSLDKKSAEEIMNLLFSLVKQKGMTMVLATHNISLAGRCEHRLDIGSL